MSDQPQSGPFQPPADPGGAPVTPHGEPPRSPYDPGAGAGPPGMPPAPPGGEPPAGAGLPWENRAQLGFGTALVQSVRMFMGAPRAAFDGARRKGDYGSPVIWLLIFALIAAFIQWMWSLAFAGPMTAMMSAMMPEQVRGELAATMAASVGLVGLVKVVLTPVVALVFTFIGAAIYHLALMVAGGSRDSASGFEGTFRACAYGAVAQIATIIPMLGSLIAVVWGIILLVIGMSSMHRISTGKALVVVLIPLFLCCACISIAIALGAASMIGMANPR